MRSRTIRSDKKETQNSFKIYVLVHVSVKHSACLLASTARRATLLVSQVGSERTVFRSDLRVARLALQITEIS